MGSVEALSELESVAEEAVVQQAVDLYDSSHIVPEDIFRRPFGTDGYPFYNNFPDFFNPNSMKNHPLYLKINPAYAEMKGFLYDNHPDLCNALQEYFGQKTGLDLSVERDVEKKLYEAYVCLATKYLGSEQAPTNRDLLFCGQ